MNPLLVQTLITLATNIILVALGALVARGLMTQEQATTMASQLALIIVPALGALGVLIYNVIKKRFEQKMLVTAAAAPAGTSIKEVIDAAKKNLVDPKTPRDVAPTKLTRSDMRGPIQENDDDAA